MTSEPGPEQLLRTASLRVTAQRLAVLTEVHAQPHADVDRIATAVRRRLGKVSTQAVYDVLRVLSDAGLVRRIEPAGSPSRFEARVADNHHHVVCRTCGDVADVDCAVGVTPCLAPSDSSGYLVDEAEVIYWGTCPACQPAPDPTQRATHPTTGGAHPSQVVTHPTPSATQPTQSATHPTKENT